MVAEEKMVNEKSATSTFPDSSIEAQKKLKRFYSLDTLRGVSILLMVVSHYRSFLKIDFIETDWFIFLVVNMWSQLANSIFTILIGVTLVLSIETRKTKGKNFKDNLIYLIKRLIFFFIFHHITVISYIAYFGVEYTFQMPNLYPGWIPQLGMNAVFSFFLPYLKKLHRYFIIIGIEVLRKLNLLIGYGPINYVSLGYMLFGTIIGELLNEARKENSWVSFQKKMIITSIILFLIGIASEFYLIFTYDYTEAHNSSMYLPYYFLYSCGMFTLLFTILFRIQDNRSKQKIFHPVMPFSTLSLTFFFFHLVLLTNLFIPIGLGNLFSVYSYVVFLFVFYMLLYLFSIIWSKSNYKYSLEWILRKFT